jgi:hypothetical protein
MNLEDLPANSEKDERVKAILEHPLETEADWRHLATLIDAEGVAELQPNEDRP